MSSFFALNIGEFVRNSDGTFGLKYVSGIMGKMLDYSFISKPLLTTRAVSVTVIVVAISLFFGFCWNLFLKFITYCKGSLRDFGGKAKKSLISTLKIFGLIIGFPLLYVLSVISHRRRGREPLIRVEEWRERRSERSRSNSPFDSDDIVVIEESPPRHRHREYSRGRTNRPFDSDEIVVIEEPSPPRHRHREYSRGRSYRSSRPTSRSMFAGLFSLFGLQSKSEIVVAERYSSRRSDPPRRYQRGWFGGRQPRRTERRIVEERYSRRGSISSRRRWYGDYERRSVPERRNWLPWNWFKKTPAPAQRRSREIRVEDELGPTGLKLIYAWFIAHIITPLLKLFGITKRTSEERGSDSSGYFSYEYGSGTNSRVRSSVRSSDTRSRHTRRSSRR
jgi:hypothetical protein